MVPRQQEKGWPKIIAAVTTELGFFSLVVLVLESFLGGLAMLSSGSRQNLLVGAFVFVLVLVVTLVALKSFYESRRIDAKNLAENDSFAAGLAEEIHTAFDGSLRNLNVEDRVEAYTILRDGTKNSPHVRSPAQRRFSEVLVEYIIRKSELKARLEARKNVPPADETLEKED